MVNDDEIIQYIIVNSGIKLSRGKLGAQCGHAAVEGFRRAVFSRLWNANTWARKWSIESHTKIVVKATEQEMKLILKNHSHRFIPIYDEGRTEIETGTLTCLGSVPMPKSEFPEVVRKLKLL